MMIDVQVRMYRQAAGAGGGYRRYRVAVAEAANVIDVIEAVWRQDETLLFRHACHHASCGTCAVRVNGYEQLPCIVPVQAALAGRDELLIEPLRNFPVVADLVVDVAGFFAKQQASGMAITRESESGAGGALFDGAGQLGERAYNRFENCIECGICLSACPTMAATDAFFGPAGLAAVGRALATSGASGRRAALLRLVDGEHGVWQCHAAWECTEACPQAVRPAEAIMALRRALLGEKVKRLVGKGAG
jgi:succinate dehydrogenase / fumarate reductase iron-sulfur subunit